MTPPEPSAPEINSPPLAQQASGPRVEFYVIEDSAPTARLRLACRLAEKAYLADQSVLVWHTDPQELKVFDDLLWTFGDRSFVPHELLGAPASTSEAPVMLSSGALPVKPVDILINLAPDVPACMAQVPRIAEIIDGDDTRRRAGRARFKTYRDIGLQPVTHNIRAE
jgi:DNA polymerase III subunit chi